MVRPYLRWLIVALTMIFATIVRAQNYPAYGDVYVNDFANVLTSTDESQIRQKLIALYDQTGIEAVVVTMATMKAFGHKGEIEPFATGLFNHWGVGHANLDNGVMLLVARDDRQMRIELGAGFDSAMDRQMQRIIDNDMLPDFRRGDFDQGIKDGVDSLIDVLDGDGSTTDPAGFLDQTQDRTRDLFDQLGAWIYAVVAGAAALAVRLYRSWGRRRPRRCPVDGARMLLVEEIWDDNHLQQGQITEERVGSIDYDVWDCPACNHVTVEGYHAWFSRYGACRACGYRTTEGTTTILRHATTASEGLKQIDYYCHNCDDRYSVQRTIPQKNDSSSGAGRSSFGGGSSRGGGSSGRW